MEDFFKQFRDNLEHRPEPDFEERDWQHLEKRLDGEREKRPVPLVWWLAVPLLLLAGFNVWLFRSMRQAGQRVASLEIRRDTTVHTRVVYVTDTIYQTRVVRERVVEYLPAAATHYADRLMEASVGRSVAPPSTNSGPNQKANLLASGPAVGTDSTGTADILTGKQVIDHQKIVEDLVSLDRPDQYLHHLPPTSPLLEILVPTAQQKKTLRHHLYAMRPKGFQMGVLGGWAYPFTFDQDLQRQKGYSVGAQAAIEFSPHLRLWTDATYIHTDLEVSRMGNDIGVPTVSPPADDLVFLKAELPQPSLQYSLGMQYFLRANHRFRPYLGLGYGVAQLLPYEVGYEFENKTLGTAWMYETQVRPSRLPTDFWLLQLGVEYRLSKHWNAQLRGTYRSNLDKTQLQSPKMLGVQGGLNYRF